MAEVLVDRKLVANKIGERIEKSIKELEWMKALTKLVKWQQQAGSEWAG